MEFISLILLIASLCMVNGIEPEPGKMTFSSPQLSDEETHSNFMPANLRCDACTAVAHQLTVALKKAESRTKTKKLKESEYLDVFEKTCGSDTYQDYGLKQVEGVNRLSGPGLYTASVPGMLMGGGKWPGRLSSKCFEYVGDMGEDEMYDAFREEEHLNGVLCQQLTKDCEGVNVQKVEL